MPWAAAAAVVGAGISAYSSSKASKAQTKAAGQASDTSLQASQEANAMQKSQYDQSRADSAPWVNTGEGALNQLAWKMGITPTSRVNPVAPMIKGESTFDGAAYLAANPDVANATGAAARYRNDPYQHYIDWGQKEGRQAFYTTPETTSNGQPANSTYQGDPADFGSLSKTFTMPDAATLSKKFTLEDYQADPGYQFRLDEGNKGVERSAAARGGQLSGATMKALARFGQNTASGEYQNAYNRYNNDQSKVSAEYQNAYNRFNNDQSTQYNRLSGVAGTGQTQVNQVGIAGQNYANNVGNNLTTTATTVGQNTIGAADARAASYMKTASSVNNAINTGVNYYQQQNQLNNTGSNNMAPVDNRNTLYRG